MSLQVKWETIYLVIEQSECMCAGFRFIILWRNFICSSFFKMYNQNLTNENKNSSKKNLNHNLNTILFSGSLMPFIITALTSGRWEFAVTADFSDTSDTWHCHGNYILCIQIFFFPSYLSLSWVKGTVVWKRRRIQRHIKNSFFFSFFFFLNIYLHIDG